jgi:signal transduction histidine kinase
MTDYRLGRIRLGFRTRFLLIYTAMALLLVFAIFAAGSYYINRLQRATVSDAVQLAQDQAMEVGRRVSEVLAQRPLESLPNGAVRSEISGLLEFNLRLNRTVTWVGLFDSEGNCVVERNSAGETIVRLPENAGETHQVEMPTGIPGQSAQVTVSRRMATEPLDEHEVRQPIPGDGRAMGEIRLRVAESPVYQRMETSSRAISNALVAGCLLLLLAFVAIYGLVSNMVSKQVQLVRHSERTDRMAYVGTLASGLAHEIRNPLSAMNVNLEVLKEDLTEAREHLGGSSQPDTAREASDRALGLADRVQNEIKALGTTLSHFLDFALPSKEGMTEFSLRGLVEEIVDLHREQCRLQGIAMEVLGAPAAQTVIEADRRLCHQALRNIIINAIQILDGHLPRMIRIRVEPEGNGVRAVVSDTGPGIPEGNLDTIFDAFVSGRKGGTGLGLALARKIVEEHHGSLKAVNNADGPGASFVLHLPNCQPG